ncbi:TM2 domain-containing protein [Candidatus Ulvibacter alkanivorans]|jgi:TM2 domain-containing membrane protein YozV|uniref:TM2 domain-containing protein n=1 Tax=Candidatus Ulvibacter alkanivorans TaxID=2267620 RepID=UPI000DF2150D|nr:TM2 domain-containing protein [Candidatus Ulvibacter alkanivorans]
MEENTNNEYDSTKKRMEDSADNLGNEAKSSAKDFKEGWNEVTHSEENKKMIAGILAIVIGSLGIHKFILGYTQEGIIQIVITIVTCGIGGIIGLIVGIIYLTKSDEEFYQTYQVGKKGWF